MKNKIYILAAGAALLMSATSCIQEYDPQSSTVTQKQAAEAPGSFDNFVSAITSNISGKFTFGADDHRANDFGYTCFWLIGDVMGQDMVPYGGSTNWWTSWYQSEYLGSGYINCQYFWTFYYGEIKNCNTVIGMAGDEPTENFKHGAGIARAFRALFYIDLSQMFAQKPYGVDPQAPTVPIISDKTEVSQSTDNPRATNEDMYKFILADLDAAETLLDDYNRPDRFTPDKSVVYGLKARAYLYMEDWANAEKYAKLAQEGYSVMTNEQYCDRNHGFNDAEFTNSWMLACGFKSSDPTIQVNDGDNCWGTWMTCEFPPELGYYNAYSSANIMDRHLYESIPATDARKKCYLDFAIEDMDEDEAIEALKEYSDVPEYVYATGVSLEQFGGLTLKFRSKDGNHETNQVGYCQDLPMMRVEEMVLIEAEAAGRQNEGRGIQLLTDFAKLRDPGYVYGTHNEAYYNTSTPAFVNEIWWQRRVEFWGEGKATPDIKRLQKGIIRSYAGSNHIDGYRWNVQQVPDWMNICIVQTESNYNTAIVNNPTPVAPDGGNSPEFDW